VYDRDEADTVKDVISGISGVRRVRYCNFTGTKSFMPNVDLNAPIKLIILTGHLISFPFFVAALSVPFTSGVM
jgi:hypothetical protein